MGNVETDVASTISTYISYNIAQSESRDMHNTCENGFEFIFLKLLA